MKRYAKAIKERRKKLGLTQKELANNIHVSQQAIARWENEQAEPSLDSLRSLSLSLGVPIEYFIDANHISQLEEDYVALFKGLIKEDQLKVIDFIELLKRQELERKSFIQNKIKGDQ